MNYECSPLILDWVLEERKRSLSLKVFRSIRNESVTFDSEHFGASKLSPFIQKKFWSADDA